MRDKETFPGECGDTDEHTKSREGVMHVVDLFYKERENEGQTNEFRAGQTLSGAT